MTAPVARRGFTLGLPDGFIPLPVDEADFDSPEVTEDLVDRVAALFELPPDGVHAKGAAAALAGIGLTAGAGGLDYSAVALYRSPDDPMRPVMIVLGAATVPSDHHRGEAAVQGLLDLHEQQGRGTAMTLRLPIGPAVAVVAEEENVLSVGTEAVPVLTRDVSLWVPDPDGTTLAVVTVQTNCWQDWERVCVVAKDIFDTFEWQPLDEG